MNGNIQAWPTPELFVKKNGSAPPVTDMITEAGDQMITEAGDQMIIET